MVVIDRVVSEQYREDICLDGLRKIKKKRSQDNGHPDRDLNRGAISYETEVKPIKPQTFELFFNKFRYCNMETRLR